MDDDNKTSEVFKIFFNNFITTVGEIFKNNDDYTNYMKVEKYDTNCTQDFDCMDVGMFCNVTVNLCKCSKFHTRNENTKLCEYQASLFNTNNSRQIYDYNSTLYDETLKGDRLNNVSYWFIIGTMIFGTMCLLLCAIYACLGDKEEENKLGKVSEEELNIKSDVQQ